MRMLGEWRIIEMEVWEKDFLDLMGSARIAISARVLLRLRQRSLLRSWRRRLAHRRNLPR
jgi:hypothetical protein